MEKEYVLFHQPQASRLACLYQVEELAKPQNRDPIETARVRQHKLSENGWYSRVSCRDYVHGSGVSVVLRTAPTVSNNNATTM